MLVAIKYMKNLRTTILTLTAIFFAVTNVFLAMGKDENKGVNFLVSKASADAIAVGDDGGGSSTAGSDGCEGGGGEGCN